MCGKDGNDYNHPCMAKCEGTVSVDGAVLSTVCAVHLHLWAQFPSRPSDARESVRNVNEMLAIGLGKIKAFAENWCKQIYIFIRVDSMVSRHSFAQNNLDNRSYKTAFYYTVLQKEKKIKFTPS